MVGRVELDKQVIEVEMAPRRSNLGKSLPSVPAFTHIVTLVSVHNPNNMEIYAQRLLL